MRIDRVVVNASPLICLSKGGLLHLLDGLFSEIAVPDKVYHEVGAKGGVDLSALKRLRSSPI
jgi:predicted nucleic acid-binding protein